MDTVMADEEEKLAACQLFSPASVYISLHGWASKGGEPCAIGVVEAPHDSAGGGWGGFGATEEEVQRLAGLVFLGVAGAWRLR